MRIKKIPDATVESRLGSSVFSAGGSHPAAKPSLATLENSCLPPGTRELDDVTVVLVLPKAYHRCKHKNNHFN